jgi:hypothetical protein
MLLDKPRNIRCYGTGWSVSIITRIDHQLTAPLVLCSGFDYRFNAIENEHNELFTAYKNMFEVVLSPSRVLRHTINSYFPIFERYFVRIVLGLVICR